jgi:uncharacterized membrane protein
VSDLQSCVSADAAPVMAKMATVATRVFISGPCNSTEKRERAAIRHESDEWLVKSTAFPDFLKRKMHAEAGSVHVWDDDSGNRSGGLCVIVLDYRAGRHLVTLFRGAETHTRSVLKAVSWRTLGTLDTFAISWFMTGKVTVAGSIAGMEIITKIAWYYLHERIWAVIPWGRRQFGHIA